MKKLVSILTAATMISGMAMTAFADEASFVKGDVDKDGIITGHDAAMVSMYADGILSIGLTEEQLYLADINGDGTVDAADAALIAENQEYVLGDIDLIDMRNLTDFTDIIHMTFLKRIDPEIDFGEEEIRADIDCNGVLDIYDYMGVVTMYGETFVGLQCFEEGKYYFVMTPEREQLAMSGYKERNPEVETLKDCEKIMFRKAIIENMDMDGDGAVTCSDATAVLKTYAESAAGIYKAADDQKEDINGDGKVDIDDATLILKAYAMNAAGLL
ncbi:MAG: hypothetical protein K2H01_00780 [Ruminococcus sp.]|nr:hypothetical protein [Ruminococcus sp.]